MTGRLTSFIHAVGHLAGWAGVYVAAAWGCFWQLSGHGGVVQSGHLPALAFCFLTATPIYLLDRVKLMDAWLDPADEAAHPKRFQFLVGRSRRLRALAALFLGSACVLGVIALHPLAALMPLVAVGGVVAYAAGPRRTAARPKDVILLKNAFVAAGICGFAVLVSLFQESEPAAMVGHEWGTWAFSAGHLFVRVFADAALCDLDDEAADRAFGTRTLAAHFGRVSAWNAAMAARLLLACAIAVVPVGPQKPRLVWAAVTIVSSLWLRLASPARVRDWVDVRFGFEYMIVQALMMAW